MATFIVRIELHDADDGDYQLLNFGMEVQGFSLTVTSSKGHIYWLPQGEYFLESDSTLEDVYKAAKSGAQVAKKGCSVIVSEAVAVKWRGLRRLG